MALRSGSMVGNPAVGQVVGANFGASPRTNQRGDRNILAQEFLDFSSQTSASSLAIRLLTATVDEYLQPGGLVSQPHRAGSLVLVLTTFSVPALENFLQVSFADFVGMLHHARDRHLHVGGVLFSATVFWYSLNTMYPFFPRKQVGGTQVLANEAETVWPGFFQFRRQVMVGQILQIRQEQLLREQFCIVATLTGNQLNQHAAAIKAAPKCLGGLPSGRQSALRCWCSCSFS